MVDGHLAFVRCVHQRSETELCQALTLAIDWFDPWLQLRTTRYTGSSPVGCASLAQSEVLPQLELERLDGVAPDHLVDL